MSATQVQGDRLEASGGSTTETPTQRQAESRRRVVTRWLEAYALLGLLFILIVFFSLWPKTSDVFPTAANLQIVFGSQSVLAVIALGALFPLICNEWDLSVGPVAALSAVMSASAMSSGMPIGFAILLGVGLGALVGLTNALLVTRLGTNGVITTLGTATIVGGVLLQKTGGLAVVSNIPTTLTDFGSGNWLGLPRTAWALAVVAAVVYFALNYTVFGRHVYALGSNAEAALLVGIRTKLVLASTFVLSGSLAGLGGAVQVARAGGADPKLGDLLTLPALAAAFLSAAAIRPGRYNVGGLLVAVFFLAVLNSGLNIAGAQPYVALYVNGLALIVGVGLAVTLGRKGARSTA